MLKTIAPLTTRLRHLLPAPAQHPPLFRRHGAEDTAAQGGESRGQLLAEHVAALVGSWPFIIGQSVFLLSWFLLNVVPFVMHWDPYPWMAANILMSAEAAFTGPILLIAANVGAMRDHAQYDRIEHLVTQNEQLTERLAQLEETILARLDHRLASAPSPVVEPATPHRRRLRNAATAE